MTGFDSKRTAALDKLAEVTEELGLYAQPTQEPVAFYNPQHGGFYWAKPTTIHAPQAVDIVPLALYATPPAAQPAQEPVAWGMPDKDGNIQATITPQQYSKLGHNYNVPLYTSTQLKEKKDEKGVDNA